MNNAEVHVVVPVKRFKCAKQRLARTLSVPIRARLAAAMLEDVLDALSAVPDLAGVVIVTVDEEARRFAAARGVRVMDHCAEHGHTAAVNGAAAQLAAEGVRAVLTLPGDIPLVSGSEISNVIEAATREREFVIVPAHDRRGSNAVLCAPPGVVTLQFGNDSFLPHLAAARAQGIEPQVLALPGIGQDIDNPKDLETFIRAPSSTRTYMLLAEALQA